MGIDAEIRNLLARIAHTNDEGTLGEYIDNFAKDAVWQLAAVESLGIAGSIRRGHDEILAGTRERREAGVQGPGSFARHVITTVEVYPMQNGAAIARSTVQFFGQAATTPTLISMAQYDDEFRESPDGWKLAHRVITMG